MAGKKCSVGNPRGTGETSQHDDHAAVLLETLRETAKEKGKRLYEEGPGLLRELYDDLPENDIRRKRQKKVASAYISRYASQEYQKLLLQAIDRATEEREEIAHQRHQAQCEKLSLLHDIEVLRQQVFEPRPEEFGDEKERQTCSALLEETDRYNASSSDSEESSELASLFSDQSPCNCTENEEDSIFSWSELSCGASKIEDMEAFSVDEPLIEKYICTEPVTPSAQEPSENSSDELMWWCDHLL